jgi:TPR repeat protein
VNQESRPSTTTTDLQHTILQGSQVSGAGIEQITGIKKTDDLFNEVIGRGRSATEAPSSSGSVLGIEFDPLPGLHDRDTATEMDSSATQLSPAAIQWLIQKEKNAEEEKEFERDLKRAQKGSSRDQCSVAESYEFGIGVKKNLSEAIKWYMKSAENGEPSAQCALGAIYIYGKGLPRDLTKGVMLLRKAKKNGDEMTRGRASLVLDRLYDPFWWSENKEANFIADFRASADAGSPEAQLLLAECYLLGTGVKKNPQKAFNYYVKSANQGNAEAQFSLATLYENGTCGFTNIDEAEKWYAKSAKQGYPVKQKRLLSKPVLPDQK